MSAPRILIIAGSDSGGGAGIQADIKTVTMLGGHAMTAITAITAQNTLGVQGVMPVPADMVIAQIDSVVSDIGVDAVKIGMLGSAPTAHAVADRLEHLPVPIIFDPVMVATSGSSLVDEATIDAFERLLRVASVATPNVPELGALARMNVRNEPDRDAAVEAVMDSTRCPALLVTGGHALQGQPPHEVHDCLYDADYNEHRWVSPRIDSEHTHGTGCTLASAIACGLGQGRSLHDSIDRARIYVQLAIRAAPELGRGHGPMGHGLGTIPFDLIHSKSQ